MIVNSYETRKAESFIDIFKGTCELNGFNPIKTYEEYSVNDIRDLNSEGKFYYLEDESGKIFMRSITFITDTYAIGEMVNMAVKTLYNADLTEVTVLFDERDKETFKLVIEDLETLDITCGFESMKDSPSNRRVFEIRIDDKTVAGGYIYEDEYIETYIDYGLLENYYTYFEEDREIDAYVVPLSKDVFSDAFIIASNLKDAGLRIEVDYSLGEKQLGNSDFLIELDEKTISSYKIKLTDRKTHEVKELSIDDLAEALLFI